MTARTMDPFDPEVVAPWTLGDGRHGVLLLHGFASSPPEMRPLGDHLAERGFRCVAPALAGHATRPSDLRGRTWQEWSASAETALSDLRSRCETVSVVGQSMGGTLALHLAATNLDVRAVATLAAPIHIRSLARPILPVMKHVVPWYVPRGDVDLYRREGVDDLYSYGRRSTEAIHELFRLMATVSDELAMIRQPVLLLHGRRDKTVDPVNVSRIGARLACSREVASHTYPRSGHAISVDVDSTDSCDRVGSWFERHTGAETAQ